MDPETYYLAPNRHAPNNPRPVLVYRQCLPLPLSDDKVTEFLESHSWVRRGIWGHIAQRHFHPNSHECYGVVQGDSTLLLGCGHNDSEGGQELDLSAGDVIVLPAGTGHCNLESTKDYRYIGVYPKDSPHWRNEIGKEPIDLSVLRVEIEHVEMPAEDPVHGPEGPLMKLWTGSDAAS